MQTRRRWTEEDLLFLWHWFDTRIFVAQWVEMCFTRRILIVYFSFSSLILLLYLNFILISGELTLRISSRCLVWPEEWLCGGENLRDRGSLPSCHFMKSISYWCSPTSSGSCRGRFLSLGFKPLHQVKESRWGSNLERRTWAEIHCRWLLPVLGSSLIKTGIAPDSAYSVVGWW